MAKVNGTEISLMPTDGMKVAAKRYKKWKQEGKKGGTAVAARRATQIPVSYTHLTLPTTR